MGINSAARGSIGTWCWSVVCVVGLSVVSGGGYKNDYVLRDVVVFITPWPQSADKDIHTCKIR